MAAKIFPWWLQSSERSHSKHVLKWCLCMTDDRFRRESNYMLYFLDLLLKARIHIENGLRVSVFKWPDLLTKDVFDISEDL